MANKDCMEVPYQVDNPSDQDRYGQLKYILSIGNRPEDFENIVDLLKPPVEITTICSKSKGKNIKVAVIGAGTAGLSAAFELKKIGCDITIFEASDRIGGRVYTHYFSRDKKYYGELGPMRVPASHETSWHYINLFKLNTSPFPTKNVNGLFYIDRRWAVNDPQGISVMKNIYPRYKLTDEEAVTPWQQLLERIDDKYLLSLSPDTRRELIDIKPYYKDPIRMIDSMNYRAAYGSVGLSEDAITMLGYLSTFDFLYFNISLTEIMQQNYTVDTAFTYRIDGGFENLSSSFYNALINDANEVYEGISKEELGRVKLRMNTAVDGIYKNPDRDGILLECRGTRNNSVAYKAFDYVVCAIPFTSLRRIIINPLFSVRKMQAIRELNYEDAQKTFFFLKDRFWEKGNSHQRIVGGNSSSSLPIISTYYPPDHSIPVRGRLNAWDLKPGASPDEPGVLLASYNWSEDAERSGNKKSPLRIMDMAKQIELLHCLPQGFIGDRMLSWVSIFWPNVEYIWGGGCLTKPEDKTLFSYVITLPEMDNRLFFAGEHISQKHLWLQGSLKTGMIAANGIAEQIKLRRL